jgi:hypothetical protein
LPCHPLLLLKHKEKGDDNLLLSPSLFQQHHRKRHRRIVIIFFFSTTPPQKKTMAPYYCLFLLKHKENKTPKKKPREGRELTFKLSFCLLTFGSRFYFLFQTFSPRIFFFSSRKKNKEKKNHREKRNVEKGRSLPSSSCYAFSFLAPISTLLFFPFRLKCFLLGIFFFSSRRNKRKTQRKKKP